MASSNNGLHRRLRKYGLMFNSLPKHRVIFRQEERVRQKRRRKQHVQANR